MPYPFFIWAAALFVIPAMGLAMGVVWAALMVGFFFAVTIGFLQVLKAVAQMIPVVRELIPAEVPAQEVVARRLEAEEHARRVAEEIEAEIQEVAQEAREALQPGTVPEATALLEEARQSLKTAQRRLDAAEAAAKQQSGGWMAVCEARDVVSKAEAKLADVESVTGPLLLTSGEQEAQPTTTAPPLQQVVPPIMAQRPLSMQQRNFASRARPLVPNVASHAPRAAQRRATQRLAPAVLALRRAFR